MENTTDYIIKTIFIGNSHVGKTSLINKIINKKTTISTSSTSTSSTSTSTDVQIDRIVPTYGVDYYIDRKTILKKQIKNQIWDLSGSEQFNQVIRSYYKNIDICVFVFDLTDINSFNQINKWLDDFNLNTDKQQICTKILLGNKTDMILRRCIKYADAVLFAERNKMTYIETSAKTDENNSTILNKTIETIISKKIHDKKYSVYSTSIHDTDSNYTYRDNLLDNSDTNNSGCLTRLFNCCT